MIQSLYLILRIMEINMCFVSVSFDFGCVQMCKCLWLWYGEVGKHISMENVHSETDVWHFITVFGFCMLSASNVNEHRDSVHFEVTVCCKNTTHCFHICVHVIVLWMYTNAIKTLLKIQWLNNALLHVSPSKGEHRRIYSQVLTLYMSAYL